MGSLLFLQFHIFYKIKKKLKRLPKKKLKTQHRKHHLIQRAHFLCLYPILIIFLNYNESHSWVTHSLLLVSDPEALEWQWRHQRTLDFITKMNSPWWWSGFLRPQKWWHFEGGCCRFTHFCLKRVLFLLVKKYKEPNVFQPQKTVTEIDSLPQHCRLSKAK